MGAKSSHSFFCILLSFIIYVLFCIFINCIKINSSNKERRQRQSCENIRMIKNKTKFSLMSIYLLGGKSRGFCAW